MPTMDQAKAKLQTLIDKYNADMRAERSLTESDVIQKYIEELLRDVLGWDISDSARYQRELHTIAGRPDLVFTTEKDEKIYIEAKRFGKIEVLEKIRIDDTPLTEAQKAVTALEKVKRPDKLPTPGKGVDRTQEEQQAINYAFQNDGKWAILTNFERFRLFNARRDWLVLSFESPEALLSDFDLLWELSYDRIVNGSLDALSNQRYREDIDPEYLKFINEWRETLANDIVAHPNDNPWVFDDAGKLDLLALRGVVQRFIDRMVIIRFAEDWLVIPAGTLNSMYELTENNPYVYSKSELITRFFRGFDKEHNSALFAENITDQAVFSDKVLKKLMEDLYLVKYRAMPADILGNTYEQYLGKALTQENGHISTRDNLETRKKQGSYYTPQVIVRYIVDNSLGRYLYGTENGQPDGTPIDGETRKTSKDIANLRVLDSACGSGSFLINAYYVLERFYRAEIKRIQNTILETKKRLLQEGKSDFEIELEIVGMRAELERLDDYPNQILEKHIYGTDLDPQAAEIAVVNLMMRAMERQGGKLGNKQLPLILNQNVKVGNALIGLRYDDPRLLEHSEALAKIRKLRIELIGTSNTDPRHDVIVEELQTERDTLYAHFADDFAGQFSDVERVKPFHWGIEFPEAFYDEAGKLKDNAGFDVIVGNPPWEIVMPDEREFYAQFDALLESKLQGKKAENRIKELNKENPQRKIIWESQKQTIEQSASYFSLSDDYQHQYRGHTATHKLFIERMYTLLNNSGRLGYVVPSGIYTDLGTKELREMLLNQGKIDALVSLTNGISGGEAYFPSVHRSFKITLLTTQKGTPSNTFQALFRIEPSTVPKPNEFISYVSTSDNFITIKRETISQFSPNSLGIMEFQSQQDYDIAEKIYSVNSQNEWNIQTTQEFNMTTHRGLFNEAEQGFPLYEGKMIHQYDSYFAKPRYWITEKDGAKKLENSSASDWYKGYRFSYRDVARATDERTCIATILPPNSFSGHTLWIGVTPDNSKTLFLVAILNSFCVDSILRFQVGTHLTLTIMKQLPVPRLNAGDKYFDALVPRAARLTCVNEAFADLWVDVMGEAWTPPPSPLPAGREGEQSVYPVIDPDERQVLRDEIDALVAHLYGLSRDEFAHILGTFPLVFPDDESGRAKKDRLLSVYDELAP